MQFMAAQRAVKSAFNTQTTLFLTIDGFLYRKANCYFLFNFGLFQKCVLILSIMSILISFSAR